MNRIFLAVMLSACLLGPAHSVSWDSENQYRLIVELEPDKLDRKNCPVSVEICFPKIFAELGINDQLDQNSIQVIAYNNKTGKPEVFDNSLPAKKKYVIPSRIFYPAHVYTAIAYDVVAWNMRDNSSTLFAIYFDTMKNGPQPRPEYFHMIGAGEPIVSERGRFTPKGQPFGSGMTWGDLDGDGLNDMVVGEPSETGYLCFAKNIGTKELPMFTQPERIIGGTKFVNNLSVTDEKTRQSIRLSTPLLADWDEDGDLDLCARGNRFYENVGGPKNYQFVPAKNLPELSKIKELAKAGAIDLNNDGRPERISSYKRFLLYHSSPNTAGTPIAGFNEYISRSWVGDVDNDGLQDIIVGLHEGTVLFCRNIGILRGKPYFARPKKLLGHKVDLSCGSFSRPAAADWDGDGDIDLFSGAEHGRIIYFENIGDKEKPVFIEMGYLHANGEPITFHGDIREPNGEHWGYSSLTVLDWDDDGDPDVMATERMGYTHYYENIGTRTKPQLAYSVHPKSEDGSFILSNKRVKPGFYDWNNDGYLDILIAEKSEGKARTVILYNTGSKNRLTFKKPDILKAPDGKNLYQLYYREAGRAQYSPIDFNSDGRMDFIVASHVADAWPHYYENIGTKKKPQFVRKADPKVKDHHLWVGSAHSTSIFAIDWDHDGRQDVLLGGDDGRIFYYNRMMFDVPPEIKKVIISDKSGAKKINNGLEYIDKDRYVPEADSIYNKYYLRRPLDESD